MNVPLHYAEPFRLQNQRVIYQRIVGGVPLDITEITRYVSITQSLKTPFLTGKIGIFDGAGLFDTQQPPLGEEQIIFSATDARGGNFRCTMVVNSVKPLIQRKSHRAFFYQLDLVSIEAFYNSRDNVREYYNLQQISSMVQNISAKYLKLSAEAHPTVGLHKIWIPNVRPIKAIAMLRHRAVGDDKGAFMFYQNLQGSVRPKFHFKDMAKLCQQGPKFKFYQRDTIQDLKLEQQWFGGANVQRITSMNPVSNFNTINRIMAGYHDRQYTRIDFITKKIEEFKDQDNQPTFLASKRVSTPQFDSIATAGADPLKSRNRYNFWDSSDDHPDCLLQDKFKKYPPIAHALEHNIFTIAVPGNVDVDAGDVVELDFPEVSGVIYRDEKNKRFAGNWLIATKKDSFDYTGQYVTTLDLVRDSAEYDLGIETESFRPGPQI